MESTKNLELIPTKFSSVYNVSLDLGFEVRHIGQVDFAGQGTFLTHRKPKHIFSNHGGNQGSLGINYSLLTDESIPFQWIVIDYANHKLVTSRLYFLTHGKCFKFANQGFELQCFLPITSFGLNRAREFEDSLTIQGNLFERAS